MLNIFICEDRDETRTILNRTIDNEIIIQGYDLKIYCETNNPYIVLEKVKTSDEKGVYFLDIDLNTDINGIELAKEIRCIDPEGYIVFITTHSEMMPLTFKYKVEALDYIVKDDSEVMKKSIRECLKYILAQEMKEDSKQEEKKFCFKSGDKDFFMNLSDIIYFETTKQSHKIKVVTSYREVEFYGKLNEIEKALDERFYRSHQSYIVNCNKVKEIYINNDILMENGEHCKVSVRKRMGIRKYIDNLNFNE